MSHQDGLGNNRPETPRLSKPDDGDDRAQKKSENVAHASDAIKLKKLKNSMGWWNSPTTPLSSLLFVPFVATPLHCASI
jgi:hypothetical protein